MVRQRSAKPLFAGSIPAVASNFPLPNDFHFRATVESHGWYRLAPFRWDGRVLRRAEALDRRSEEVSSGRIADLEMWVERGRLRVEGASEAEVGARIARMFQLGVDTSEFVALTRDSKPHEWVERSGFGRLLCGSTLFEDVVKIIATTNVTWSQTVRMVELLVEKCGRRSPQGFAAFPSAEDVARFSAEELQRDCKLGYRAKSIRALADIDLATIGGATTEEWCASYRTLPGIGPYGAAHLLAMDGRHDFIAVDTEFRRFVRETYHGGRQVSDRTMLRRYAKWGRWKYLAYWAELWGSVAERLHPTQRGEDQ